LRAFAIDAFGEAGSIRQLPDPVPGEGEVLVRVAAAGLSTTDLAVISGWMKDYMEHVFPLIPGIDGSGIVERVGPGVEGFREGDEVFGYQRRLIMGRGTLAELAALPADGLQQKPSALAHHQAAIIPHAALTATAAVDAAALRQGARVAILGATGGVGSFATQLATQAGAPVIAVTRGEYTDYARSLGAAEVIDYEATDAVATVRERYPDGIDALIDLAGIPELATGMAALVRSGGRVVSVVLPPDVEGLAKRGVEASLTSRMAAEDRFGELTARIVEGKLKLPAIQTFPYDDVDKAIALQSTRHVHGKLAILIS
jgi:NADPH:quinone reductase-like Zn-dependent oxidoreductase